ncbi:SCO family protein [Microbulbifer sp. OS29]|uniref:SCO family protein n=1 Tax=Microbulbifer okhotskensis TaxID=2926617 RepID=A0A9X2J6C3_9GAMM|nr:SCO family protein [Microbulbifer okhotskensis]MCO1336492.1 SCO family protein [Microbulbifer okhotskensis]
MNENNPFTARKQLANLLVVIAISIYIPSGLCAAQLPVLNFGGDFTLINQHGSETHLSDYRGKVVIMSFGFTSCPDICPVTMNQLKYVMNQLGDQSNKLQNILISIDPERDTPSVLKKYLAYFDPSFIGLTGSLDDIKSVAMKYHSSFKKREMSTPDQYIFGHTVSVFLIDQQGQLRGHYKTETELDKLISATKTLVAEGLSKEQIHSPKDIEHGSYIEIEDAWVRYLPPGVENSAAYMTIVNTSDNADRLISISSPIADSTEVHESYIDDGMAVMRPVEAPSIDANGTLAFEPRGLHIMLLEVGEALKIGEQIDLTLSFENAGVVDVRVPVKEDPGIPHSHH